MASSEQAATYESSSDEEYSEFSARPVATKAEIKAACVQKTDATKDFAIQQTMLRIKDPRKSLKFYTGVLGMSLIHQMHFPTFMYSSYFVGYDDGKEKPKTKEERVKRCYTNRFVIELQCSFTYGDEREPDSDEESMRKKYSKPGFGFIGIAVPDIEAACERFEKMGVPFEKKLKQGSMQCHAFIKDPDKYSIKIYEAKKMGELAFFGRKRRWSEIEAHNKGEEYTPFDEEESDEEEGEEGEGDTEKDEEKDKQ